MFKKVPRFILPILRFQDAVALELGGGCGFIGIVVSNWVRHCFCTGTTCMRIYTCDDFACI